MNVLRRFAICAPASTWTWILNSPISLVPVMFRSSSFGRFAALGVIAGLMASVASAQTVYYNEIARFTLSAGRPTEFGSNPSAIAWDGTTGLSHLNSRGFL